MYLDIKMSNVVWLVDFRKKVIGPSMVFLLQLYVTMNNTEYFQEQ